MNGSVFVVNIRNRYRFIRVVLLIFFVAFLTWTAPGVEAESSSVSHAIKKAIQYTRSNGMNDDWTVIALSRAGKSLSRTYLDLKKEELTRIKGEYRIVTDYEKSLLGIVAAGGDPRQFAGYNLVCKIINSERLTAQGLNGIIYALIAIDSKDFPVPEGALWTRDKLIQTLLTSQNADGGWPLFEGMKSNVDITAMTLTALAPYKEQKDVRSQGKKAITWLSTQQLKTGGFISWGSEASESAAQVIMALCSWGIDPASEMFTKEEGSVLTNFFLFQQKNGGFVHAIGGDANPMSTIHGLQALVSYHYYLHGKGRLYHFATKMQESEPLKLEKKSGITPVKKEDRLDKKRVLEYKQFRLINSITIPVQGKVVKDDSVVKNNTSLASPKIPTHSPALFKKEEIKPSQYLGAGVSIGAGSLLVLWGVGLMRYKRRGF